MSGGCNVLAPPISPPCFIITYLHDVPYLTDNKAAGVRKKPDCS